MRQEGNIIYFDNDQHFTDYCLKPERVIIPKKPEDKVPEYIMGYYDYEYTDEYLDAVKQGMQFVIEDKTSRIMHRGYVTKDIVSKKVSNLLRK